ncbi:PREDICTED: MLO-like protein 13 [Lupinus angustifolius]|uniref:MLO-like protein 13 n=1 Tax=Lupinus angustifolius TaxID=3871 RepID=UPI00092F9B9E|nr:PREDICTED: MLO-like protein 13 [Lupinus angustifolius]
MAEELNQSLEYTPTWIVAGVCSIIVFISLIVERCLHWLGKYLKREKQTALYEALIKLQEELMLLGFISLLLTVTQNIISDICIPPKLATQMLPCKRPHESSEESTHRLIYYDTIINRRRLFSTETGFEHCKEKGKVPLLSQEALHHLHIFIFVLAIVHAIFCVTTMLLGGARIRQWKTWEDDIRKKGLESMNDYHHHEFFKKHADGYWRRAAVVGWLISFFKQFYGSVTESDYTALRQGFIKEHCSHKPDFNFHKYIMRTLEVDFKKIVGIRWHLWLFVVLFLLLNLHGWHTYFWLSFLPLIILLLVGAKLEHIIVRLAQESVEKLAEGNFVTQAVGNLGRRKEQDAKPVKPSDGYFWFNRPALVLDLLHFTLFQNSFEIAFFFWIWCTYGFDSCIMEKIGYIIPRIIMGVIVQVLCSYSTLPLYTLVTQMGSRFKKGMFDEVVEAGILSWAGKSISGADDESSEPDRRRTMSHKMIKESFQPSQISGQAIIMVEDETTSTIELPTLSKFH